jgi:hypothetical protein
MIAVVLTASSFSVFVSHFFQGSIVFTHVFPIFTPFLLPLYSIWSETSGEKRFLSGEAGLNRLMWVRNWVGTSVIECFRQL